MTRTHPPEILASNLYQDITLGDITGHSQFQQQRSRSKSAPRLKATLTPVPISVSPPQARNGRDGSQAVSDFMRTAEIQRESTSKPFLNEVHPIKLQPHTPLYVSDCFEQDKTEKPAVSPHVRCRVDIKPDAAVLEHTSRQIPNTHGEHLWQRYSQASSRSGLYVPRHIASSPTPTPSECYSGDFRQGYLYTTSMSPISYHQEHRAYSNPNIPTKFFYTEDAVRQYDPRTRWRGSYFSQTPLSTAYYGEDSRFTPYNMNSSRSFCSKPLSPEEQYFPPRLYNTEGYRRPRMSQAFSDDWYRSSISGFSSHSSQNTPPRVRQDLSIPPWFTNSYTEASRLGADVKNHSKSWDNIICPRHEREQTVPRGRSYENLFHQARQGTTSDVTAKPVILNLSSSPRRYAALSLSENSLERNSNKPWRNSKSANWFVTPEITITDNDLCAGNARCRDVHSVSWDTSDGDKASTQRLLNEKKQSNTETENTKERKHNNFSLQQSLEQLDELLADLVVDYKPPTSKKSSENLLDQLKQLITEDNDKNTESPGLENLECLSRQLPSSKSSPDTLKDPDSGCDAFQRSAEECSPDHSTDEDDTMACANKKCNRIESMFNACLYFKSCHSCYTFYCSRNCRRDDWEIHKETCLYGRVSSVCRHTLKFCRESSEIHKAFSRIAKAGYLSRGRGVLFLGFANPETAENFLQVGLESLLISPTYLSLRELDGFKDNLGEYCKELQQAGNEYDPNECFLLNVSVAVGELVPNRPSPRVPAPTVRKYAKVSLASSSPDKKVLKKDEEMETLILTPPPGTPDIDKEGEEGRKAREVCFVNIQRELRTRGVFLRHEYPKIYNQLCEFVESNKRFTPTTIYPIDKRTGKQFMCMIMAASEPRTLDWLGTPHLLDDII
uniref:Un-named hu7912 n=1 Tax=Xiphophorus couchianus TaxID=32473 RepID=A0A3B5M8S6_9TELE